MGHKLNSPSVFSRRRACPGSKRLEAGLPDKDTEYSLRGSAAHAVLEACLSESEHVTDYRGAEVVVTTAEGQTTTVKMQEDDIKAIQAGVDYVHLRQEQMEWQAKPYYEEAVTPSLWLGRTDDCDGTLDIGLISENVIEIIDYKHGAGIAVEPENNDQLLLYAIGACQKVNWEGKDQGCAIMMTIVQPRAHHKDGPVRSWVIPAHDLFAKIPEFTTAAAATDDPNAPLVPGDHCRFCKANPCEAVTAAATAVFHPIPEPGAIVNREGPDWAEAETMMGRPADLLEPQQLAAILDRAGLMKAWLKAVEEAALNLARNGTKIPGHKLVHSNTTRKWGEDNETIIKKLMGLRDTRDTEGKKKFAKADVTRVVPISITDVEKQVKPYVTERQWKTFSKLIVKPQGAPVLAPDTDSRPEIKSAEDVFQPVNQPAPAEKAPWE